MKHRLLTVSVFIFGLTGACNPEKNNKPTSEPVEITTIECYRYTLHKDTVSLTLKSTNNSVRGSLMYNLYEKDKRQGTIEGEMRGDTLIADYTFLAEGITSSSEVIFLKKENQLIQGFGETTNYEGKEVIKQRNTLTFNDALVLLLAACEE